MKHTKLMAIVTLLLLAVSGVSAQSLGDVARAARKKRAEQAPASQHFDNDNIPTSAGVSVVGPSPSADDNAGQAAKAPATDPTGTATERQKVADEWKTKLEEQKAKVDALNHELDLDQREYRLREAAFYGDAGNRLRNQGEWDKEDNLYKSDIEAKQKAIDAAQKQLTDMQEEARKAGVVQNKDESDDNK
jgi:hypothetical protein